MMTPNGMPAASGITNIRNTPATPAGQKYGSGAVGSHWARTSSFSARVKSSLVISTVGAEYGWAGRPEATMPACYFVPSASARAICLSSGCSKRGRVGHPLVVFHVDILRPAIPEHPRAPQADQRAHHYVRHDRQRRPELA